MSNKPVVNINDYHCAAGHSHEALLRKTAEQQGVVLEGKLLECEECFMAKGLHRGIKQSTHTRADKKLGRVFVDLNGPKTEEPDGEKRYTLIARDDFSWHTWVYLWATNRTPRKRSSSSSRTLVQMVARHRW